MAVSIFPYIGGKTNIAAWIIDQLPEHGVYVEPFGGAAAVLLNKPRSNIEVYNDVDSDVVQFFEVARTRTDELIEWLRHVPFSEELHNEWGKAFYRGERPEDPVERAGRFLFLRYSQFAGKYHSHSGFKRDTPRARAGCSSSWQNAPEKLEAAIERLQGVSIQHNDFREIIDRYDSEETVFYCDPPYLDKEDLYPAAGGFTHADLEDALTSIEGYALVSYTDAPTGLYDGWHVETRESYHDGGARGDNPSKQVTERLLMNFDPCQVPKFGAAAQTKLGGATSDA